MFNTPCSLEGQSRQHRCNLCNEEVKTTFSCWHLPKLARLCKKYVFKQSKQLRVLWMTISQDLFLCAWIYLSHTQCILWFLADRWTDKADRQTERSEFFATLHWHRLLSPPHIDTVTLTHPSWTITFALLTTCHVQHPNMTLFIFLHNNNCTIS